MLRRRSLLVCAALLLAVAAVVAVPSAALAQGAGAGVVVPAGADASLVVVGEGDAVVQGTAEAVIALSGDVVVTGTVRGLALAADGQVRVLAGGRVEGDAYSSVQPLVAPGGVVTGNVDRVDFGRVLEGTGNVIGALWWLAGTIALLALGALLTLALPRAVDRTVATATAEAGTVALVALLLALGVPVLILVLAVTIIGIPLALALAMLLVPLYLLGQIAAAWLLGTLLLRRGDRRLLAVTLGLLLLQLAALVPLLGLVGLLAAMYGLGALAVTGWRAARPARAPVAA